MIQKLSARVSSGATSGVGVGGGGGRDPLKGVDVAGLEEISIAEGDWQSVFRCVNTSYGEGWRALVFADCLRWMGSGTERGSSC